MENRIVYVTGFIGARSRELARRLAEEKNLPYLDGMEVDYAKQGLNEGFRFRNPNVKDTCGCGESFNV